MARLIITDTLVLSEPRRIELQSINPGRTVRIDNPDGEVSFYIVNKIPVSENINTKPETIPLTNLGSGRLVQKRANMKVIPVSCDVLVKLFPEIKGNK